MLRDAFGEPYEVELLDIYVLEDKFFEKTMGEIIRMALEAFVPEMKSGVVYFDLSNGSFVSAGLGAGEDLTKSAHLVKIYEIPQNFYGTWFIAGSEDFFYPDDLEKAREILIKEGTPEEEVEYEISALGVEGVAEKLEMNEEEFQERLVSYLESFTHLGELWEEVEKRYWELVRE